MGGDDKKINDDTCKLYIGGINPSWDTDKIKVILEEASGCDVMRVDVVKNFAFAFVANKDDGIKVIEKCNGKTFDGSKIVIQISKNKQNLPDSDDLCFECGKPGHWAKECEQRRARTGRGRRHFDEERPMRGPPIRERELYDYPETRYPPAGRERAVYGRGYAVDPYARDYYARDPYYRDPYAPRDPYYSGARYTYDYGRYATADPYAPRATAGLDACAAERERLAYGRTTYPAPTLVARSYEPATSAPVKVEAVKVDPYAVAPRRVDPYEPVRRVDPYEQTSAARPSYAVAYPASSYPAPAAGYSVSYSATYSAYPESQVPRAADPYAPVSGSRYASEPVPKRYPEPAYAPRAT